jgi:protein Tex
MTTENSTKVDSKLDPMAALFAAKETKISGPQVEAVLKLLFDEDCTVPFITRYRKEKTGGLDEENIRDIQESYENYIEREKRREYILKTLKEMEVLTPELEKKILAADTINKLEDIYAPYKSKKKTKGQLAQEAGLGPLADDILAGKKSIDAFEKESAKWLNPEKKFTTWDEVLLGVRSILIELFAHDTELKETLRSDYWKNAKLVSSQRKDADKIKEYLKFKDYFEFEQPVMTLKDPKFGHRYLAMRRGMTLKILKVEVQYPQENVVGLIQSRYFSNTSLATFDFLQVCAQKAVTLSIHSSLDLEIKAELKKLADESAIDVFGVNLKNLLLQPYLGAKTVIALDPGVRTGCKTVVIDKTGKLLFDTVIYPHPPKNDIEGSRAIIQRLIEHFNAEYIAIGNGTYGRETLSFLDSEIEAIKKGKIKATLVNEDGASIYSASPIAKKEFPDKDATVRGAVSIARRFQDPLAELVKIDPKSIGVGQYQHDVNQSKLKKSLSGVVESCVNFVGVDINTASAPLLSYISGVGPSVAENIVKTRESNGGFKNRQELLKVSRFSQKIFEQAAGFLRIYSGDNPMDSTFIHPEKYKNITEWCKNKGIGVNQLISDRENINAFANDSELKEKVGEFSHEDILKSLKAPGQDPRTEFKSTEFRKDIKSLEELSPGTMCPGIVTNITNFGAFVDIGLKENGLIHISEMADEFVSNPLEVLKVGQSVQARVTEVDKERKRIGLSLKKEGAPAPQKARTQRGKPASHAPANNPRPKPDNKALKNNAFAALKNFKV